MDWELPIIDGLTCSKPIQELEAEGQLSHLPIITITANARSEQVEVALEARMYDVMKKPFLVPELMAKVQKWTGKK